MNDPDKGVGSKCRLGEMRSSLSGSGRRELTSEVAVSEREEVTVGAVVIMVGLISGDSGVNSVTEWPISLNSMVIDTGDRIGMESDEDESIGEAIR